ncbi:MAG: GHKL domain-containing protein [Bacillota bacterium]|nr:GHKL domain-containing protein [Bacillota bacterium]
MFFHNFFARRSVARYQQELIASHFQEVESMYGEMRVWRHNYRNHIQILKSYAQEGDVEAIRSYLSELEEDLESIAPSIRTGNRMTDAIVNSKIALARAEGIDVTCDAHVAVALTTPQIDLCTIIGNLFDNAIEACKALPEGDRRIRIYMDMKNTQFYLSFTNTTGSVKQRKIDGRFLSTKRGGGGIGLFTINRLVQKHRGYVSHNSEDGAFTTEILLPQ